MTTEVEPQLTLRGHSAAITRLVHSPTKRLLYSASMDSSIRVWALPTAAHTTYAPYDATRARGELVGHTDAVWDLALVRDESTLISCGAEGTVKVWDVSGPSGGGSLRLSWGYDGLELVSQGGDAGGEHADAPGASAVEAIKTDLKKVAVAYQNAVVKIFDIEAGKELLKLQTDVGQGVCLSCYRSWSCTHAVSQTVLHQDRSTASSLIRPCHCSSRDTKTSTSGSSILSLVRHACSAPYEASHELTSFRRPMYTIDPGAS